MIIKSIKKILNIGTFSNFISGGKFRFEKLNFIYGLNAFGKTTLTDIFQSLKENDGEIIVSRKTIPVQGTADQKVVLSVQNDNESESDLVFENDNWSNSRDFQHIEIFGTNFIHQNVLYGLDVERSNRENFTQFVLGDKNVELAKQIESGKKSLSNMKSNLSSYLPNFLKGKNEYIKEKFLKYSITELDKNNLESELSACIKNKLTEEQRLKKPEKILKLPDINVFNSINKKSKIFSSNNNQTEGILCQIKIINEQLQKDYSQLQSDNFMEIIDQHIQKNFSNKGGAENWIERGLGYCNDKENGDCMFCGQSLANAKGLITAYNLYFNAEYKKFVAEIKKSLSDHLNFIRDFKFNWKSQMDKILLQARLYEEFINEKEFNSMLRDFERKINSLSEDALNEKKKKLIENAIQKIQEKNQMPHQKIDAVNYDSFMDAYNDYQNQLNILCEIMGKICQKTKAFKKEYEDVAGIKSKICKMADAIKDLEFKKARLEQNEQCEVYISKVKDISKLDKEITNNINSLRNNQSDYLDRYFAKINELFKKFGSKNFDLIKEVTDRGHKPVCFLKVKFYKQPINNHDLKKVFSESDKRALALAIFWTKIELKSQMEKDQTVVILDDPVTSFDENRILNTINVCFKDFELSQIIVLTHYNNLIKNYCERVKLNHADTKFFKIWRDDKTSFLCNLDEKEFTQTKYERIFSKIMGYLNREHDICIKNDLRPFLENLYLPTIFAYELSKAKKDNKDISSLEKMINVIFSGNDEIKQKLHSIRENLNPESHIFTSSNEEDVRNFASEMMLFLYSFKFKQ